MVSVGLWGDGVKLGWHEYFAAEHLGAARLMAEKARDREDECLNDPERDHGIDWGVRSYTLAAISEAVAFLEAAINEFLEQAISFSRGNPRLTGLEPAALNELQRRHAAGEVVIDKMSVLDKYGLTLECAGKARLNKGIRPCQDVVALISARNALVHYKTPMQFDADSHEVEKRVKSLVPKNPMLPADAVPWFPHHLLCAGVAEWAWQKSLAMYQDWRVLLGTVFDATSMPARYAVPARDGNDPVVYEVRRPRLVLP